ncbi:MAG TPA: dihydropteroate synthase [Steroidobacteraceae bacterium]|nr:dihydropteroate synthase [Steroidobacteraceae bacterium]
MGVLNVTPDSFSDGGRFLDTGRAVEHAARMQEEGAAIIDVGGESTRPGAAPVATEEELRRVIPVVEALARRITAVISVDTSRPEVMRAAAAAGAGFINDVRALSVRGALAAAAATRCAVCLAHMQGEPATMQRNPRYTDVVSEVRAYLLERVQACRRAGLAEDRIVIDPGFGFGKTLQHNLALLRAVPQLARSGVPVLVGLSRKSVVAGLTGRPPAERLPGSLALATIAALNGAAVIRAHDVAATVDALKVVAAVQRSPRVD